MTFKEGQKIWIQCDNVKRGMFPTERTANLKIPAPEKKLISAFVPEDSVKDGKAAVLVTSRPHNGKVSILFPGEVMTTTNPVLVPTTWLESKHVPQNILLKSNQR